eukprot:3196765-Rhodomonas_salina.1
MPGPAIRLGIDIPDAPPALERLAPPTAPLFIMLGAAVPEAGPVYPGPNDLSVTPPRLISIVVMMLLRLCHGMVVTSAVGCAAGAEAKVVGAAFWFAGAEA